MQITAHQWNSASRRALIALAIVTGLALAIGIQGGVNANSPRDGWDQPPWNEPAPSHSPAYGMPFQPPPGAAPGPGIGPGMGAPDWLDDERPGWPPR